jgi:hypothetical protein
MAAALSIFGVAFAAFCMWLAVRIVNRRERWAKWTLEHRSLIGRSAGWRGAVECRFYQMRSAVMPRLVAMALICQPTDLAAIE